MSQIMRKIQTIERISLSLQTSGMHLIPMFPIIYIFWRHSDRVSQSRSIPWSQQTLCTSTGTTRLVLEENRHTFWNQLSFTPIQHYHAHPESCLLLITMSIQWVIIPHPGRYEGSAPDVVPYMTVRSPGVAWRVIGSASGLIVVRIHERIRRRLAVTWDDSQFDCQCPCDILYSACHCMLPSMTNEHHLIS